MKQVNADQCSKNTNILNIYKHTLLENWGNWKNFGLEIQ